MTDNVASALSALEYLANAQPGAYHALQAGERLKFKGQHLWSVVNLFQVDPMQPLTDWRLNHETSIALMGPGCYHCEQEFTLALLDTPCPGDPSDSRPSTRAS